MKMTNRLIVAAVVWLAVGSTVWTGPSSLKAADGGEETMLDDGIGPELIVNGDMEEEGHWVKENSGNKTVPKVLEFVMNEKHSDEQSLHLVIERVNENDWAQARSQLFETRRELKYRISFWYKITKGAFHVKMRNGPNDSYFEIAKLEGNEDWERFEGFYEEGPEGGTGAWLCFIAAESGECEIFLDDVSVKEALQ